ncbi:hypothetical protein ACHAWF_012471 [Thalassiosira exigua]
MTATQGRNECPLTIGENQEGGEDYFAAISNYCEGKSSCWSPLQFVYLEEVPLADDTQKNQDLCKENVNNSFITKSDVKQLLGKAQSLHNPSNMQGVSKVSAPEMKYVFQDKENFEGRRSIDLKKKKICESKVHSQRLAKSEKRVELLENELRKRKGQLLECRNLARKKDKEIDDMTQFVSTLQDLLREMSGDAATVTAQLKSPLKLSPVETKALGKATENGDDLKENDIHYLKESISQLQQSLIGNASQIETLKSLNSDTMKSMSNLTHLIKEKDQALDAMSQFIIMNNSANEKLLAKYENELRERDGRILQLHQSLNINAMQIDSLNNLNEDMKKSMLSLTQLIGEKDQALAEMSHFSFMDNAANKKLLIQANEKHKDDVQELELQLRTLHKIVSLQLKEKMTREKELALKNFGTEYGSKVDAEFVDEVKFMFTTLAVVTVLMTLVWQNEWFFYIYPVYFLFVFYNLE